MCTNARSMGNKQEELEAVVQQQSCDVVAIAETWWEVSHSWSAALDGCKLFRRDRKREKRGRVALYIREAFDAIGFEINDDEVECQWLVGEPTRGMAMLDLLFANRDGLLGDVEVGGHLGHSDHEIIEFSIFDKIRRNISKRKSRSSLCSLADEGGKLVSADEEKAEVLNAFFGSFFSGKMACPQDNCPPRMVDGVKEQNGPPLIQEEAVGELLNSFDVHKSMGPDGIHPRLMRELPDELAKPLSIIYQQSWLTGEVPDDWKLASVTSIHKKGGKEDPGSL
ncbi:hypothetical protein TURU_010492 [Turdus rufiventris]|nr:hypothetical protein TURU_010492 [Turdus rufiventris]